MRALRLLAVAWLLGASGCLAWDPWVPDQELPAPESVEGSRAVALRPGEPPRAGSLDCKGGRCEQWFRVDVDGSGELRVEAGVEGLAERAVARLFLQDGTGRGLARALSSEGLPLRVAAPVEPGPYAVLLQVGGGPVVWSVGAAFESR
jgi:hypothetical protein